MQPLTRPLSAALVCCLLIAGAAAARPGPSNHGAKHAHPQQQQQPPLVGTKQQLQITAKSRIMRVLSIGDSITMGSVPSINQSHPYTIELEKRLWEAKLARRVEVRNYGEDRLPIPFA
jgi:hypothetical protein